MKTFLLLAFLIFIAGCTQINEKMEAQQNIGVEEVTLVTSDGIKLAGLFYPGKLDRGVVLLHQLNSDKSSWEPFIKELNKENYFVLALDLRGHGESELKGQLDEAQFLKMINDAKAGHDFMKNAAITRIAFVGASIGANLALNYGAENKLAAVALSPGLDYRGISTEESIEKIKKALIISTENDKYAFESSKKLKEMNEAAKLITYDGKAHGTFIFLEEPSLGKEIIIWLEENI